MHTNELFFVYFAFPCVGVSAHSPMLFILYRTIVGLGSRFGVAVLSVVAFEDMTMRKSCLLEKLFRRSPFNLAATSSSSSLFPFVNKGYVIGEDFFSISISVICMLARILKSKPNHKNM